MKTDDSTNMELYLTTAERGSHFGIKGLWIGA